MFTHAEVWCGIDELARQNGLTPSGLARRAGLDPTTFNPSKRITKQEKPRWPSTESLAKILVATETRFSDFVAMMTEQPPAAVDPPSQRLRCVAIDQVTKEDLFDEAGFPVGDGWDEIDFPNLEGSHAYALELRGDEMAPVYRDGDILVVSPEANIRRHDRVLLKSSAGEVVAGSLLRRTAQRVELEAFSGKGDIRGFGVHEVAWLARIVWASQ